jgi:hypothetical protein
MATHGHACPLPRAPRMCSVVEGFAQVTCGSQLALVAVARLDGDGEVDSHGPRVVRIDGQESHLRSRRTLETVVMSHSGTRNWRPCVGDVNRDTSLLMVLEMGGAWLVKRGRRKARTCSALSSPRLSFALNANVSSPCMSGNGVNTNVPLVALVRLRNPLPGWKEPRGVSLTKCNANQIESYDTAHHAPYIRMHHASYSLMHRASYIDHASCLVTVAGVGLLFTWHSRLKVSGCSSGSVPFSESVFCLFSTSLPVYCCRYGGLLVGVMVSGRLPFADRSCASNSVNSTCLVK